jgi:hypothetical protein
MDRQLHHPVPNGSRHPAERLRTSLRVFAWFRDASVGDRRDAIATRLGLSADDPSVRGIATSPVISLGVWLEANPGGGERVQDTDLGQRTLHLSDFLEAFGDRLVADGLAASTAAGHLSADFLHAFACLPLRSYLSEAGYDEVVRWARGRLRLL